MNSRGFGEDSEALLSSPTSMPSDRYGYERTNNAGDVTRYEYDRAGRQVLEKQEDSSSNLIYKRAYGYDKNGNRTSATYEGTGTPNGASTADYSLSYEAANRLTKVETATGSITPHISELTYEGRGDVAGATSAQQTVMVESFTAANTVTGGCCVDTDGGGERPPGGGGDGGGSGGGSGRGGGGCVTCGDGGVSGGSGGGSGGGGGGGSGGSGGVSSPCDAADTLKRALDALTSEADMARIIPGFIAVSVDICKGLPGFPAECSGDLIHYCSAFRGWRFQYNLYVLEAHSYNKETIEDCAEDALGKSDLTQELADLLECLACGEGK